ncbi:MAG: 30S ribosomal protein S19, partial [Candidatus Aenigmarchaeota archaeon]|nr:30S ribosomal protein S19 [Candidatus Aenigmarchaeota archaeon]
MAEKLKKKEFTFRGKTTEEIKKLSTKEFIELIPSRERRSFKRGLTDVEKKLVDTVKNGNKKFIKTHVRDMIVTPDMIDQKFGIYNGKEFVSVDITPEMLGHRLGEFTYNRKKVAHSGP